MRKLFTDLGRQPSITKFNGGIRGKIDGWCLQVPMKMTPNVFDEYVFY